MKQWMTHDVYNILSRDPAVRDAVDGYAHLTLGATERLTGCLGHIKQMNRVGGVMRLMNSVVAVNGTLHEMLGPNPEVSTEPQDYQLAGRLALDGAESAVVLTVAEKFGAEEDIAAAYEGLIGVHGLTCSLAGYRGMDSPYSECRSAAIQSYNATVLMPVSQVLRP